MQGWVRAGRPDDEAIPWLVSGLGVAFLLAFVLEAAYFSGLDPDLLFTGTVMVALVIVLPFAVGLAYGGYWLKRSNIEPERYRRAATWCVAGGLALLALNALVQVFFPPRSTWIAIGWLRGTANWGAGAGFLVGIVEARAIQNALEAERSSMRAEYLETQRDWLDYLNGLLRHEVLNNAQVINGYTSFVLSDYDLPDEPRRRLAAIRRQSDDMTAVINDVRLLIEATREGVDLRSIDLAAVVRDELQDLRDAYEVVEVEMEVPEGTTVRADRLLPRVFSNLFANAVEHNDRAVPSVEVRATLSNGVAVVRVADNGPGVPEERRDYLFDRDEPTRSDHGIGLYLVRLLVERYDGAVELSESGLQGSVFTVELPLAETADESSPTPERDARPNRLTGAVADGGDGDVAGDGDAASGGARNGDGA